MPILVIKRDSNLALLQRFAKAFSRFDGHIYTHANPPADAFLDGIDADDWNVVRWRPLKRQTPPLAVSAIRFAGKLPTLYELFALSYRWPQVQLGACRLLANELATDLQPLANSMLIDPLLNQTLVPAHYVRFATATENYDPICFDLNRYAGDDCPIVRLDHESILMHESIGNTKTIFETFRELVVTVVQSSN